MKIGLLHTTFPPDVNAGAELQTQQVAAVMAARGHEVTVFTRRFNGRPFVQQQDGYTIHRRRALPLPKARMAWDVISAVHQIRRHTPRLDVLLCYQTLSSGYVGTVAQSLLGIPAVVSIRGDVEYRLDLSLANRRLAPGVYRKAARIIVQSPRILQDLQDQLARAGRQSLFEVIRPKVAVIPNGVHLRFGPPARGDKIVYVGRLIRGKGVADLLQALRSLPDAPAVIVGDGPERPRLEEMAAGLPVEFVGKVAPQEVAGYLQQARLLVLPSYLEGLPNVILEAMAQGVPVVTTRTGGMPDVVRHEETGLLFEPGQVEQLVQHLRRLRADDALWQRCSAHGQEAVREYGWDAVAPRMEELLQEAVRSHGERRSA